MKRQIAKVSFNGEWVVEHHDTAKVNPYKVYYVYWNGGKHKKLRVSYADFRSCLCYIEQMVAQERTYIW